MEKNITTTEIILISALIFMCLILIFIALSIWQTVKALEKTKGISDENSIMDNRTTWQKLLSLAPLSMEKELTMDHKYDGITELSNPTPPWFMYLFYSTIVFAFAYFAIFHVSGNGKIMESEYAKEVIEANIVHENYLKKFANSINENNVVLQSDSKSLEAGKAIYLQNCIACHGDKGQGGVGPNLTDEYWLHGGTFKNIFHTITEGVPEKGMISWKKTLNPIQIQQLSSFLITLIGTKPANGKEPQGQIAEKK